MPLTGNQKISGGAGGRGWQEFSLTVELNSQRASKRMLRKLDMDLSFMGEAGLEM